jgi:hypothetical protein
VHAGKLGAIPLLSARGEAYQYGSSGPSPPEDSAAETACQRLFLLDGRGSAQSGDSSWPLLDPAPTENGGGGEPGTSDRSGFSSSRSEESGGGVCEGSGSSQQQECSRSPAGSCFPLKRSTRVGWQEEEVESASCPSR